jgi:hypothetical protein
MATFLYQCPLTARRVQGWAADEATTSDDQTFLPIACLACGAVHLVNPENRQHGDQRAQRPEPLT